MTNPAGKPPKLSREAIRKRIGILPPASGDRIGPVTQKAALAAFFDLENRGLTIPEDIKKHETAVYRDILSKLEPVPGHPGSYIITDDLLRGALRRVGHLSSAQTVLEIGNGLLHKKQHHRLKEVAMLKRLFGLSDTRRSAAPELDAPEV